LPFEPAATSASPPGQAVAHYLHNTGSETFAYLMIRERIEDDEVTYPPERA
jgi:uncharacterized cupin superfamily protein